MSSVTTDLTASPPPPSTAQLAAAMSRISPPPPPPPPVTRQAMRAKRLIDSIRPRSPYERSRKVPGGVQRPAVATAATAAGAGYHAQSSGGQQQPTIPTSWAAAVASSYAYGTGGGGGGGASSRGATRQSHTHTQSSSLSSGLIQLPPITSLDLPKLIKVNNKTRMPQPPSSMDVDDILENDDKENKNAAGSRRHRLLCVPVSSNGHASTTVTESNLLTRPSASTRTLPRPITDDTSFFSSASSSSTTPHPPASRGRIAPSKQPLKHAQIIPHKISTRYSLAHDREARREREQQRQGQQASEAATPGKMAYIPARLPRPHVKNVEERVVIAAAQEAVASWSGESASLLLDELHKISPLLMASSDLYVPAPPPPASRSQPSVVIGHSTMPLRLRSDVRTSTIESRRRLLGRAKRATGATGAPTHCLMVMPSRAGSSKNEPDARGGDAKEKKKMAPKNQDEVGRMMPIHYSVFAAHCAHFPAARAAEFDAQGSESSSSRSVSSSSSASSSTTSSTSASASSSTASSPDTNLEVDLLPSTISVPLLSISVPFPSAMPLLSACLHEPVAAKVVGRVLDVQSLVERRETDAVSVLLQRRRRAEREAANQEQINKDSDSDSDATPRKASSAASTRRRRLATPSGPDSPESIRSTINPSIPNPILHTLSSLPPREIHARLSTIHRVWSCAVALGVSDDQIWLGMSRAWEICAGLLSKQMQMTSTTTTVGPRQQGTEMEVGFKRVVSLAGPMES